MSSTMYERATTRSYPNVQTMKETWPTPKKLSESERLSERKRVKHELAAAQLRAERLAELQSAIASCEREADVAADNHQQQVQPIQAELQSIREKQAAEIAAGKQRSQKRESRRQELLASLEAINDELENRARKAREKAGRLSRELADLLRESASTTPQALENKLADELGNPELKLRAFVARQSCDWLARRLEAAQARLRDASHRAEGMKGRKGFESEFEIYTQRTSRWQAEVAAASELLSNAQRESDELRRKMIAE